MIGCGKWIDEMSEIRNEWVIKLQSDGICASIGEWACEKLNGWIN